MGRAWIERGSALAPLVEAAGWQPAGDGVPLIDCRAGLHVRLPPGAVVVIARGDAATLAGAVAAGAVAYVEAPADPGILAAALAIAARTRRRRAGEGTPAGEAPLAAALAAGPATVAIVALSQFDIVNAAYGRAVGDELIAAAAQRLRGAVGDAVTVVRRDGAEFLLVGRGEAAALHAVLARVERAMAEPFDTGSARVNLSSRIGVAVALPGDDPAALLRRADTELRRAAVPARPVVAADDRLAADLHHAIARDEIELRFQPQVAFASGLVTGVEALARWRHATLGDLGAGALFAAADRAGLGVALSAHIHRLALARVAAWPAALAGLRVAVNATAADLARRDFVDEFLATATASGVARARITVEVTESGLIERLDEASARLAELRAAGLRIAIDDFGTGYSSLAYLKALPLDYLKIDRALVTDVTGSPRDRVIVEGVIAMARSLGLETVAEGVETREQARALGTLGCTGYQGYLCAGPLDDAGLTALMDE